MTDDNLESFNALRYSIFAAQRDLIERCGGYKRVMEMTGKSKSEVNRWQGGVDQDFMPPLAIARLERDCGQRLVTAVHANFHGCSLTDPQEQRRAEVSLMTAFADKMRHSAEVAQAMAAAIADGHVTYSEAVMVDRKLAGEERTLSDMRASLAVIKARGGDKAELKIVGGEA